jgi:hypothetical protein
MTARVEAGLSRGRGSSTLLLLLLVTRATVSDAYRFRSTAQRAKPPYEGRYNAELVRNSFFLWAKCRH